MKLLELGPEFQYAAKQCVHDHVRFAVAQKAVDICKEDKIQHFKVNSLQLGILAEILMKTLSDVADPAPHSLSGNTLPKEEYVELARDCLNKIRIVQAQFVFG